MGRAFFLDALGFFLNLGDEVVLLEEIQRCDCGGGTGEGIASVCVAVEEGFSCGRFAEEGVEDFLCGERGGEGQVAAGDSFGET